MSSNLIAWLLYLTAPVLFGLLLFRFSMKHASDLVDVMVIRIFWVVAHFGFIFGVTSFGHEFGIEKKDVVGDSGVWKYGVYTMISIAFFFVTLIKLEKAGKGE